MNYAEEIYLSHRCCVFGVERLRLVRRLFLYLKMYEQTKANRKYTSEDLCYMGVQKVLQLRIKWEEGWCSYNMVAMEAHSI